MTGLEAARRLLASAVLHRVAAAARNDEVFLVGGSLRDRILAIPSHDHDLVTTGDPARVSHALARAFHGRAFVLGRPPKAVWRVVSGRHAFDISSVGMSLERDIRRRDYTVNAMLWRLPRGPLVDLVGGIDDLAAGRLRVVAAANLADDPLRVLRGLRLAATRPQLSLTRESEGLLAAAAPGLAGVARERVLDELRRMLAGVAVRRALAAALRTEALAVVVPAWAGVAAADPLLRQAQALQRLGARGHGPIAAGAAEVALATLAAPAAGFPDRWDCAAARHELEGLGISPAAARRLAGLAATGESLARSGLAPDGESRVVVLGTDAPGAALAWAVARRGEASLPRARSLLAWRREFLARPALVGGHELGATLGIPAGPARARALRVVAAARARGEVRTRRQALALVRSSLC